MVFRIATLNDLDEMKKLYVGTIMEVCADDYSIDERKEWSNSVDKADRWVDAIETQYVLLAEIDKQLAGYGTLKDGHYIDFFYVHKDFQRKGIAQALLEKLECKAISLGCRVLKSDISLTAKTFFLKKGFVEIARQENIRGKEVLINFKMEKTLQLDV